MSAIEISNLKKIYANGVIALRGIDLKVEAGEMFALLGPNGAGKTTAIGIITSLVNKTSGQVKVFEYDIDHDLTLVKSMIGVVPQEFNFGVFEKVIHILVNQAGYYGIPAKMAYQRSEFYLKKLGLWDKRDQPARFLSGGMKRRLMIARALVHEPKILILDEPTAGVDIELRRSMWEFVREINAKGTTVILTTHYLEEAENLCRRIAIIDHGEIIANSQTRVLLAKLHTETLIFYLKEALTSAPDLNNFPCKLIDDVTLEVDITKEQSLNELFSLFEKSNIQIMGMRNKANRLEELFLKLTSGNKS